MLFRRLLVWPYPASLCLLGLWPSACSRSTDGPSNQIVTPQFEPPQTTIEPMSGYFANAYFVSNPSCQAKPSGGGAVKSAQLTTWLDGKSTLETLAFTATEGRPALVGAGISSTFYGLYQQTDCGSATSSSACPTSAQAALLESAVTLNICQPSHRFERTSVEGVALTSLAMIEKAYNFYNSVTGHLTTLPVSSLLVLPKVEKLYLNGTKRVVNVDNLAYYPDFAGSPAFIVFPKGAYSVSLGRWVNVNLWEIPWTLAHEFGHHVFRFHSGIDGTDASLDKIVPVHSFPTEAAEAGQLSRSWDVAIVASKRVVANADILAAVNEGYADLFAYYVNGSTPGMTKGVDCFEHNRDAGVALFATGQAKILTATAEASFLSPEPVAVSGDCSTPSFQDIHAIGAIFAHGVDQMFSTVASGQGADAAAKKAALLLDWSRRIGDTYWPYQNNGSPGVLTLGMLANDALAAAAQGATPSPALCQAANAAFPTYTKLWCQN